jgi:hypothetical protein
MKGGEMLRLRMVPDSEDRDHTAELLDEDGAVCAEGYVASDAVDVSIADGSNVTIGLRFVGVGVLGRPS